MADDHQIPIDTLTARVDERKNTNWIAMIRLMDGTEIPCNVRDISKSGAKLGVPQSYILPKKFMFKVIGRDFVCLVSLAWRKGDYAGVRIERVGKVETPAPDEEEKRIYEEKAVDLMRARRSRFADR